MVKTYGGFELARRINKLASYRLYDRKYPYSGATKTSELEKISIGVEDGTLETIIADEAVTDFMDGLTQTEQEIAALLVQGFKPRDIAKKWGKSNSGSVRWHKHQIKRKLRER